MPLFYFDFDDCEYRTHDVDEHEIASIEAASAEAIETLLTIIRDRRLHDGYHVIFCTLRDDDGQIARQFKLSIACEKKASVSLREHEPSSKSAIPFPCRL